MGFMGYRNTFIAVAPDTTATAGKVPLARGGLKTIALLEYQLISARPYALTQEEIQFAVHVERQNISASVLKVRRAELWEAYFSKPMACMRTSPLPKTYGWGLHFNDQGKVALVPMESAEYRNFLSDPALAQACAMRSKRP
jgi:hypothetical protein